MQLFDLTHHAKDAALHYVDVQMDKTVSTHASREGRDQRFYRHELIFTVSTHASREERDWLAVGINRSTTFQLTRPVKDATRGPR